MALRCYSSPSSDRTSRTASTKTLEDTQHSQKRASKGIDEGATTTQAPKKKEPKKQKEKTSKDTCSRSQSQRSETMETSSGAGALTLETLDVTDLPKLIVTAVSTKSMTEGSTTTCCPGQSLESEATEYAETSGKPAKDKRPGKGVKEAPDTHPPPCKRGKSGDHKHETPPCCKKSIEKDGSRSEHDSALWSQAGRLRPLEEICYCNACIGLTSSTCKSPRMALKKSHTGRESRGPRATKTL